MLSKPCTITALTLALAIAASAHAAAAPMGDMYPEAIWDIHTAATPGTAGTGPLAAQDLYREAAWDADGSADAGRLTGRQAEVQEASRPDAGTIKLDTAE